MTEETFAYLAFGFLLFLGCGIGFFIAFIEPIDRWLERRKKKRAWA